MNKLSKDKRDKLILVAIGTLVILAGLWFGLISSQKKTLVVAAGKTREMKDKVANAEKTLKRAESIEGELAQKREELQTIEDTMASGDLFSWFLTTMNKFLSAHSVDGFTSTSPVVGEVGIIPKFPYKAASYTVKLNGFYHDLGKFTAEFENAFPYSQIRNLDVVPLVSTKPEDREKLEFKFEVVTLVKPIN